MRADARDNRTGPASFAESVIARLRALREQHPDARVATELSHLDETVAIVHAAITLPNGGSASGFGSAGSGGHDAVEDAETRALNRALTVLGFVAATPPVIPEVRADQPQQRVKPVGPVQPTQPVQEFVREPVPDPIREPVTTPEPERSPAPPARQAAPARTAPRPEPARAVTAARVAPAEDFEDDPPLADYSWTEFWKWARSLGFDSKQMVEELIGQSISNISPAQVRVLLREKTDAE